MWRERKLQEQQDLRASGKAEWRVMEEESETQERTRAADRQGRRKHEQPQQGTKLHSLVIQGASKAFVSLPMFISFIHVSLPELWVPKNVCSGDGM